MKTKLDEMSERIQRLRDSFFNPVADRNSTMDILKELVEEVKRVDQKHKCDLDEASDDANLREKRREDERAT